MITDDPIRDLERQLVRAAATLAQAPVPAPRPPWHGRWRWRAGLAAAAIVLAVGVAVIGLGGSDGSKFSVARAVAGQLSPDGNRIVQLRYTSTFYDDRRVIQRVHVSTWYSASTIRTVATTLTPTGRHVSTLETVRTPRLLRSYESSKNLVTVQKVCRRPEGFTDPIATLRRLLAQGRLTPDGQQRFDGIEVKRLQTERRPLNVTFLARAADGAPVAMTTDVGGVDRTVVRFTAHSKMHDTAAAQRNLALSPHPGSRVLHLRPAC